MERKQDGIVSITNGRRLPVLIFYRPLLLCGAIAILLIPAASCRKAHETRTTQPVAAAPATFTFAERIGWFQGPCLAISNSHLAQGTSVALVVTGEPQKIQPARILEPTTSATTCKALLPDRAKTNATPGVAFYALETTNVGAADMGIGIVEPPAAPAIADGLARADLLRDGQSEVFTSCATSEGIKFAVWTAKSYQGDPRWSGYDYLGYDMQPTCP